MVMPFQLENIGAKCQVGRSIKVYMDKMLENSHIADKHLANLRETFITIKNFWMELNITMYLV